MDTKPYIERILLDRFQIMSGTRFAQRLDASPHDFFGLSETYAESPDGDRSGISMPKPRTQIIGQAISRLLRIVHKINRKPLRPNARDFEGVM